MQTYAKVEWTAEDVQSVRPNWPLERCEEELAKVSGYLRDCLIEKGHEILDQQLPEGDNKDLPYPT